MSRKELLIAPVCEGALVLVVALAGCVTRQPLIFASLGPTAFELIETPERPSARPYNIVVGHLIAVLAGFFALGLTHAWSTPPISSGTVSLSRAWAAAISAALTVLITLLVRATQPAALSTALLISLGTLQSHRDGFVIMGGVLLMTALGEPLRRWRARTKQKA